MIRAVTVLRGKRLHFGARFGIIPDFRNGFGQFFLMITPHGRGRPLPVAVHRELQQNCLEKRSRNRRSRLLGVKLHDMGQRRVKIGRTRCLKKLHRRNKVRWPKYLILESKAEMNRRHAQPMMRILGGFVSSARSHPQPHTGKKLHAPIRSDHVTPASPNVPEIVIVQSSCPIGIQPPGRIAANAQDSIRNNVQIAKGSLQWHSGFV